MGIGGVGSGTFTGVQIIVMRDVIYVNYAMNKTCTCTAKYVDSPSYIINRDRYTVLLVEKSPMSGLVVIYARSYGSTNAGCVSDSEP